MSHCRLLLLPAALLVATGFAGADDSATVENGLQLLLTGPSQVRRLELRATIDGKPVAAVWDGLFASLVEFFDRDNDGSLDADEAARLPNLFTLRQLAWGQFAPKQGSIPLSHLDRHQDQRVSAAEFACFCRERGLGEVLVATGDVPSTDRLTDALLARLDKNSDGNVGADEWELATELLTTLDRNGDELVGPGELIGSIVYPGAAGSKLITAAKNADFPARVAPNHRLYIIGSLSTEWIDGFFRSRDRNGDQLLQWEESGLTRERFASLAGEGMSVLSVDRMASLFDPPIDGKTNVAFSREQIAPMESETVFSLGNDRIRWRLRTADSELARRFRLSRELIESRFDEMDANKDDILEQSEIKDLKRFEEWIALVDRDADGRMSRAEQTRWLDLMQRISESYIILTAFNLGRGLFELLDENVDGGLSRRELAGSWSRLASESCIVNGAFDRSRLPQQWLATLSRGQPTSPFGNPPRSGPQWFLAMDRNSDGDVSRAEFLGDASAFQGLDRNRNDQIDAAEAAAH